jgi:hypothetical protein
MLPAAALCLALAIGATAAAPSAEAVRQAASAELATPGYQTALPDEKPADAAAAAAAGTGGRRRVDQPPAPAPGPLAGIAGALVWVLVAAGALAVLAFLLRDLLGFGTRARPAAIPTPDDATMRAVVAAPLRDAEALAAEGHFGEAIHVLLLRTLAALVERGRRNLPTSLTSREIIAEVQLPADADAALRGLVSAVEVSHFGGQEPAAAEWQLCLEHFHRFARAFGGRPEAA